MKTGRIFEYIQIFVQFSIQIFIRTFVRVKCFIRIYSDIHSCKFFDTNIFEYSFVSKFLGMSHSVLNGGNIFRCGVLKSAGCRLNILRWPMLEMSCTWKLGPRRPLQLNNVCTIVPRITQQCSVSSNTSRITFKLIVLRDMAGTFLNPVGRKHMLTLERHLVPASDIADDG